MYLALTKNKNGLNYILRQSYPDRDRIRFRDLVELGPEPARHIIYPGGNAFYIDPAIGDAIGQMGVQADPDEIEDLFWPFVAPDIRLAVDHFRNNRRSTSPYRRMSREEKERVQYRIHAFDKRRIHYLRFGNMNQGPTENMPPALFRKLLTQSRDEIEQGFLAQEGILKPHELKSYIYTIFDLQRFFRSFMAKAMPQALDQEKVDTVFLEEICRTSRELFGSGSFLHDYLIRYVYLFFDTDYAHTRLLDDMAKDFMFRHRFFRPPKPPRSSMPVSQSLTVFNLTKTEFSAMNRKQLTRRYRKLAADVHPDRGGSHQAFIALGNAYQRLLEQISRR